MKLLARAASLMLLGFPFSGCECEQLAPPLAAVTQTIGTEGGAVSVVGVDGGRMDIEFRTGALPFDVDITVTPLAGREGVFVEFQVAPGGLLLQEAATVRYTPVGELPQEPTFLWSNTDEEESVLATHVVDGVVAAEFALIGDPVSSIPGALVDDEVPRDVKLAIAPLECNKRITDLQAKLARSTTSDDMERALTLYDELEALQLGCASGDLQAAACAAYVQAEANATVILIEDLELYRALLIPLIATNANVQRAAGADETCNDGFPDLLSRKFDEFITFLRRVRPGVFGEVFLDRRLSEFFRYERMCQLLDLGTVCDRFGDELYPFILRLLRETGYQDCLDEDSASNLSRLFGRGQFISEGSPPAPGARRDTTGPFMNFADYTFEALEADVAHCTNSHLSIQVFEGAAGVPDPVLVPGAGIELDSRGSPPTGGNNSQPNNVATISVPEDGSFSIGGTVRALVCPTNRVSGDDLIFKIGSTEIARNRRSATGGAFDLGAAPADILLERDLAEAGLPLNESFELEIFRAGDACSNVFTDPFKLFTISVTVTVTVAGEGGGCNCDPATENCVNGTCVPN